jgi:hypothetical protein
MQFLAGFEAHGFSRSDADFGAGAGVAAYAGFAGADAENAKSAQFDALAGGQGLLQALKNRIHRGLCLGARQACALDYMMDDVLLNQRGNLAGATGLNVLRLTLPMLQVSQRLRNNTLYPSCFFLLEKAEARLSAAFMSFFSLKFTTSYCFFLGAFVKSGSKVFAIIPQDS